MNLSVLQVLQQRLLPEARPWHLAELLVSGLLQPAPAAPDAPDVPPSARVDLEFAAGVRQELLAEGTRRETALAVRVAFDHLATILPAATGAPCARHGTSSRTRAARRGCPGGGAHLARARAARAQRARRAAHGRREPAPRPAARRAGGHRARRVTGPPRGQHHGS